MPDGATEEPESVNDAMEKNDLFTAVVLAADRTARDPISLETGAPCKAFARVGGIPMIIRVLDALEASGMVKSIVLCGPPKSLLPACPELEERIRSGRVVWLPNLDSPSRSARSGLSQVNQEDPVLLTTADHALLTPAIVQYFLRSSQRSDCDAAVGVVRYEDVAAAFPGARRTVIRLKDANVCGCNLYAFLNDRGRGLVSFWQRAEDLRKRPVRLIMETFGFATVFYYLLGLLTIARGLRAVRRKTAIRVHPVFLPYPQAGVDVDKVADLVLAESVLAGKAPAAGGGADLRGPAP